jgi:hypothetical protein
MLEDIAMARRFAGWLVIGVWVLMGALCLSIPLAAAYPWLFATAQVAEGYQVDSSLLIGMPQIVMSLAMLPLLAIQLYGLFNLKRTFVAAARAEWFSPEAVAGFRRFAWSTVWLVPVTIIQQSVLLAYVSWLDPAKQNILAINIESKDVRALIVALLFLFVAQIFSIGQRVDEDARSIL